jgi:hypothetical protein
MPWIFAKRHRNYPKRNPDTSWPAICTTETTDGTKDKVVQFEARFGSKLDLRKQTGAGAPASSGGTLDSAA